MSKQNVIAVNTCAICDAILVNRTDLSLHQNFLSAHFIRGRKRYIYAISIVNIGCRKKSPLLSFRLPTSGSK